ncbi:MAG TPA: DUF503 domain-containing protein [Firmicutes bacterium]|nr:DUF503 domain-containing protein [Bacillota bacterium]
MIIGTLTIRLYAPWVHSLKEKRMEVKSLIDKTKNKFNVSIAEIEGMDTHQIIVLGIGCVSNDTKYVNSVLDEVINFIETNTEAEVVTVDMEIF